MIEKQFKHPNKQKNVIIITIKLEFSFKIYIFFLSFELVDFPNENSFFKFFPCLKLQNQRNNMIFSEDLVSICSTSLIFSRNPFIFTSLGDQKRSSIGKKSKIFQ